ncbi:MAG: DUF1178 family protein [Rhodobacteraceae bacterium]|nr:MAG: DUF1178 family protein [Paracoccaceae bacterium]
MIRFSLSCDEGHDFDSWFQSGAAYDTLVARGMVACPVCGDTQITKALMAPAVSSAKPVASAAPPVDPAAKLAALRAEIEAHSEYVGPRFAQEARSMYLGDIPNRAIYGEAPLAEAKALIEDGVPVLPLPFMPTRKTN